jgi:hypothetical protein
MSRKPKYPEHLRDAAQITDHLLDMVVSRWISEDSPHLISVATALSMNPARVRKLLITAGERDRTIYYDSVVARKVFALRREGKSIEEIAKIMGLCHSSVLSYLPHEKGLYGLESKSAEAERIKLFRARKAACEELKESPEDAVLLWKAVIAFENFPFQTNGRGKDHTGAVRFTYTVSREGGPSGHHYRGRSVPGYGNELQLNGRSISRSTVDLAFRNARLEQEKSGFVSGPRKLSVPGAQSYLYAMFLRFGVISVTRPSPG